MASTSLPGGTFTLADDLILTRMGYGAMQLAGPHVFAPPKDHDGAIVVLCEVVRLGINHILPALKNWQECCRSHTSIISRLFAPTLVTLPSMSRLPRAPFLLLTLKCPADRMQSLSWSPRHLNFAKEAAAHAAFSLLRLQSLRFQDSGLSLEERF